MIDQTIYFENAEEISEISGRQSQTLKAVEDTLGVQVTSRDVWMKVAGEATDTERAIAFFEFLRKLRARGERLQTCQTAYVLQAFEEGRERELESLLQCRLDVHPRFRAVTPRTLGQARFVQAVQQHDVTFGIGPAGTGKTYLAMAAAVSAFLAGDVSRIILTRPAIEAGEALGFLPGDLQQKIMPYLRPLYDALYDMMEPTEIQENIERGVLEIAPLAYMRGRTLNNAFVILDESQNTTPAQMFMFLTRLGREAKAVITGDLTQVDLPAGKISGLAHARERLHPIPGIAFHTFEDVDVVRHSLVRRIIQSWDEPSE